MSSKGTDAERELFNLLWKKGFTVMRSPTSGGGRKHAQPDLLASDGDEMYGIECKSSSERRIYVEKEEMEQLQKFCKGFGCKPLLGVRFNYLEWKFFPTDSIPESSGDSFKVEKEHARYNGLAVEDLVSSP